jgi:diguanylate cyclase (GGDEF)-like protein/PAS domain S-box-containing protein
MPAPTYVDVQPVDPSMPRGVSKKNSSTSVPDGLESLLNAVADGLCGLDATGHITFSNDALLEMTGYKSEEIVAKSLHDLLHRCSKEATGQSAVNCSLCKCVKSAAPAHARRDLVCRKDGSSLPVEYWLHTLAHAFGATVSLLTLRDISAFEEDQKAASHHKENFEKILANVPDVAWTMNQRGHTTYISPKVETVLGYSPEEIYAGGFSLWSGRIHLEDVERVIQAFGDLFENQKRYDEEYRIRRKDETWVWVHDRATLTCEEDGTLHADGMFSDITRRKQAEIELRAKGAFLEAQANSTIDGMLVLGVGHQRILLNQRLIQLFGIPPPIATNPDGGLLVNHLVSMVKDPQHFLAEFQNLDAQARQTSQDEIELINGAILERRFSPVVDSIGVCYGRIWTFRDITERKKNDDALRQLSLAVEQSPVSVIITDPKGRISYVNRKFTECTGYTSEEAIGNTPAIVKSGRTPLSVHRSVWSTILAGKEWRGEFCNKKKNGEIYWDATTITPVVNARGVITHFLSVQADVTGRKQSERELRLAQFSIEHASDAIFWMNKDARIINVNRASCRSLGFSHDEMLALHIPDIDPLFPQDKWSSFWQELSEQRSMTFESQHRTKEGRVFPVEVTVTRLEHDGEEYAFAFVRDLTARKLAEKELRVAQFSVEHASDACFWIDAEGHVLYANQSGCVSLGYAREELVLLSIPDIAPKVLRENWPAFWQELKKNGSMTFESTHITKERKAFPVEVTVSHREFDGKEYGFSFVRDITLRKFAEEQIQTLAYYDALTGLPNRILLRDRLTQALATARRQNQKTAVLFVDLDRFKVINDSFGHAAGDYLLQEATRRLTKVAREQDTVARLGGDEFIIVINNVKNTKNASIAAERFMDAMTSDFLIQGQSVSVGCSVGISIFPDHAADTDSLIKNADTAMYCAKENGRNNYQIFTPNMNAHAVERLTLENGLRLALEREELFLVYQPQLELSSGKIVGVEALLRWRHPELGLVPPDQFIAIAENCGLIVPIGEWVLRTACAQARKWQAQGLPPMSIAVNVSAVQFRQAEFPKAVRSILDQSGIEAQCLELELTESILLSNADVMFSILQEIKTMGLKLAIDDFGTGYSSLSYLKRFPVSKLKIDRTFIRDVAVNADDAAITSAIISMAKSLNLKVIAEGVENEAQTSFLRARGCDEIQGYYFSKPLTAEDAAATIRNHSADAQAQAAGK